MKTSTNIVHDAGLRHTVAQLEASMLSLFGGFPTLCGFSVQDQPARPEGASASLEGGLFLTAIGLYPMPGMEEVKLICEEIRLTLDELIEESPEARELLRGRTFARTLQ